MKFSVGDPVYVKSNQEEGILEEFIGKDMASIRVNTRSYFVYLEDLEHPYLRWFLQKEKSKPPKPRIEALKTEKTGKREASLPEGIYLVFYPQFKIDDDFDQVEKAKIFLYNETDCEYFFSYACRVKGTEFFGIQSDIRPMTSFYLHDIDFEDMANSPLFEYRFVVKDLPQFDNEGQFALKPKKLFEKIETIRFANSPFFHFLLFTAITPRKPVEVIPNLQKEIKNTTPPPPTHFRFSKNRQNKVNELDLHIEKLVPQHHTLVNSEILSIQIKAFQQALDLAIATQQSALILIHGIGKGTLKQEIHKLLNQTKEVSRYVNEFDSRYGYGATKVFFHYPFP